jgi:S1-C subfamily serine protease
MGCGGSAPAPTKLSQEDLIERVSPAVVAIETTQGDGGGYGSGAVIDADRALVLTNSHVVAGAPAVSVRVGDETNVPARVIGRAPCDDLAVIQLLRPQAKLTELPIADSETVRRGQHVTALGYPGTFADIETEPVVATDGNVSSPLVSSDPEQLGTDIPTYPALIQHQAAVNHGNSGGPLVNDAGELIGVNSLTAVGEQEDTNYSISSAHVLTLLDDLEAGHSPGWLGMEVTPVDAAPGAIAGDLQAVFGYRAAAARRLEAEAQAQGGLYVTDVTPGSPADKSLYNPGDFLTEVNGTPVRTIPEFCDQVLSSGPGSTLATRGVWYGTAEPDRVGVGWSVDVKVPRTPATAPLDSDELETQENAPPG